MTSPGGGGVVFSDIASRYDAVNSALSLGRDHAWRRSGIAKLPPGLVLDLGAGTGAANLQLAERTIVSLDPSLPMLAGNDNEWRVAAVGEALPFADDTFNGVFSAFVFRNLDSVDATLAEIHRVLVPGGAAAIVDLGRPPGEVRARVHRTATSVLLPLVGRLVGGAAEYRYLHESLDKHPPPEELLLGSPLRLDGVWRMGPLGFVWGAVLRKP